MDKPFTPIVIATISGIILSYYFSIELKTIITLLILGVLLLIYSILKDRPNFIIILFVFIILGVFTANIKQTSSLEDYSSKRYDFIGIVDEVIEVEPQISKYRVQVKQINRTAVNEKIILRVIGSNELSLGDGISFNGVLNIPMKNTNPMLYNYKLNLLSEKIHTIMTIDDYSIEVIGKNTKFGYYVRDKFARDVTNLFTNNLKEDNAQLITSIILGTSSYLEEDDLIKYRELGLAHILAVSGLHIGVISGFLIYIFSRMGLNRKINVIISLIIIWVYSYLIGFPPSTVRASFMFSVLFYSQLLHEPYDSINTIMLTMLISLFINPFWLFHIGFQLSYLATLSILVFTPKITQLFYPMKNKFIITIAAILAVNIGLLLIQAYYFNRIPILGIISNLITVPLLSFALIIGIIMIFINYFFPFLNIGLGMFLDLLLSIQYKIVEVLYSVPINSIKIFSPNVFFIFLYFISLCILFKIIDFKYFKICVKKAILFYLLLLVMINVINVNLDESIVIDFIDVGQGDAILIRTQGSSYLMDTGGSLLDSFDIGKNITLPYLEKLGINNLDAVIITHFDEDHSQGLYALMEEIKIKKIYSSYKPENINMLNEINSKKIPISILRANDLIKLDNNTSIKIIWPNSEVGLDKMSSNNKSLVSKLVYKDYKILFTGDIEKDVEGALVSGHNLFDDIDILKVPHHGSSTSSTEDFIYNIMPEYSIISVGRNNYYGHPTSDVLSRLESINSSIYRTDEMGLIRVLLDNDKLEINSYIESTEKSKILDYLWEHNFLISIYAIYFLTSYIMIRHYKDFERKDVLSEL